jgi:hypothetical protein
VLRHNGLIHLAELLEAEPVAKAEAAFEQILRGGTAPLGKRPGDGGFTWNISMFRI